MDFKKFQSDAHHLECSDSFALPKTEAEFAGLMADLRLAQAKSLARKANQLEEDHVMLNNCGASTAPNPAGASGPSWPLKLFGRRGPPMDGRSTILAMPSSFNNIWTSPTVPVNEQVDWPTAQEYAEEGDNRTSKGALRALPGPRRNVLDERAVSQFGNTQVQGREIPWKMRQTVGDRWDLHAHERQQEKVIITLDQEIPLGHAPSQIRELIAEMEKQFNLDD